jgi:CRP/FNR family transcriptional activator FtrB
VALNTGDAKRVCSLRLFKKVSDPSLPILLNSASLRQFPARILLFKEGDQASALYTLIHGAVELFSESQDRRVTIEIIRSTKLFMLTSVVDDLNPMSARTLEGSELLVVPVNAIHALINTDSAFARAIAHELARDLRTTIEHFKTDRLRTAIERLAEWLLRSEQDAGGAGHFVIPYAKGILASHLGMTPESLSRNLASLASLGVVVQGRHVSLTDRAALVQFARLDDISRGKHGGEFLIDRSRLSSDRVAAARQ